MVSRKAPGRRQDRLLTISQAATELAVTPATLRNWDRAGKLKAHRHPINGYRLYRAAEIVALKNEIQGSKG
jgi:DNA-binding transcriptional MerR regulator